MNESNSFLVCCPQVIFFLHFFTWNSKCLSLSVFILKSNLSIKTKNSRESKKNLIIIRRIVSSVYLCCQSSERSICDALWYHCESKSDARDEIGDSIKFGILWQPSKNRYVFFKPLLWVIVDSEHFSFRFVLLKFLFSSILNRDRRHCWLKYISNGFNSATLNIWGPY